LKAFAAAIRSTEASILGVLNSPWSSADCSRSSTAGTSVVLAAQGPRGDVSVVRRGPNAGTARRLSPDAYPVDEHVRGIGPRSGIAATGAGNRKVEDRKNGVAGGVERPIR
jgi:hypothetical protein